MSYDYYELYIIVCIESAKNRTEHFAAAAEKTPGPVTFTLLLQVLYHTYMDTELFYLHPVHITAPQFGMCRVRCTVVLLANCDDAYHF